MAYSSSRLELAHLLGQHPESAIQLHILVDALDRPGLGPVAFGIAALQAAPNQVLLEYIERCPQVARAVFAAVRTQHLVFGDRGRLALFVVRLSILFDGQFSS